MSERVAGRDSLGDSSKEVQGTLGFLELEGDSQVSNGLLSFPPEILLHIRTRLMVFVMVEVC